MIKFYLTPSIYEYHLYFFSEGILVGDMYTLWSSIGCCAGIPCSESLQEVQVPQLLQF